MKEKKCPLFYGWLVVIACFLVMGVSVGVVNNSNGVYVKPVCADMGFSRGAMAMNNTIIAACQMAVAFLAGRIYARFELKSVMRVSGLVMGLGYMAYSQARNLWMFYGISLVVGLAQGLLVAVSVSMLITNWFHARRGTAMGIASMGSGVGGMICNPLAAQLIGTVGWRQTYLILGAGMLLFVVPACFFIIRTRPADVGLSPYGESPEENHPVEEEGLTARSARKTAQYWALSIFGLINGMSAVALVHNVTPHLSDVGFSPITASAVASVSMGFLAFGKALVGYLYDKLGPRRASFLSNGSMVLGFVGMLLVPFRPAIGLIVLGCGVGGAFGAVATPILTEIMFGRKEFGAIVGAITAFGNIGAMVGPVAVSSVYDMTGSYKPALFGVMVLMMGALVGYQWILRRPAPREKIPALAGERKEGGM